MSAIVSGEPVRLSVCHCLACQRRSGGPFGAQARFQPSDVILNGDHQSWTRTADSGNPIEHHFCPICGSTVWYHSRPNWELFAIPIGAFADPEFPAPEFSIYEARKHTWVTIGAKVEHHD
ncbi:MAG: GFA family protein [Erythrobacter sp.]